MGQNNEHRIKREPADLFRLDPNDMDEDWSEQGKRVYDRCMDLVEAQEELDRAKLAEEVAKDDLKETYARLDALVRLDPEHYKIKKLSEGAIENVILLQEDYRKAKRKVYDARTQVIDCTRDVGTLKAALEGLSNKKSGLEKCSVLWAQGYFADPRVPKEHRGEVDSAQRDRAFGPRRDGGGR